MQKASGGGRFHGSEMVMKHRQKTECWKIDVWTVRDKNTVDTGQEPTKLQ